jgi:hypothetical protein
MARKLTSRPYFSMNSLGIRSRSMRSIRIAFVGALSLAFGLGGPLALSGCGGKDTGEGGVKIGGAQVDPEVEARDKAAASQTADAPKK